MQPVIVSAGLAGSAGERADGADEGGRAGGSLCKGNQAPEQIAKPRQSPPALSTRAPSLSGCTCASLFRFSGARSRLRRCRARALFACARCLCSRSRRYFGSRMPAVPVLSADGPSPHAAPPFTARVSCQLRPTRTMTVHLSG